MRHGRHKRAKSEQARFARFVRMLSIAVGTGKGVEAGRGLRTVHALECQKSLVVTVYQTLHSAGNESRVDHLAHDRRQPRHVEKKKQIEEHTQHKLCVHGDPQEICAWNALRITDYPIQNSICRLASWSVNEVVLVSVKPGERRDCVHVYLLV
jgi:hypothetical protein